MFTPGQFVVCTDDKERNNKCVCDLRKGTVYTIAGLGTIGDAPAVHVAEIDRTKCKVCDASVRPPAPPYFADRFRPLDDSKLAIFRKLLEPIPEKETA